MIHEHVSAYCRGELKLKDLIGHKQMEEEEREESNEALNKGFEALTALLSDEKRFERAHQEKINEARWLVIFLGCSFLFCSRRNLFRLH